MYTYIRFIISEIRYVDKMSVMTPLAIMVVISAHPSSSLCQCVCHVLKWEFIQNYTFNSSPNLQLCMMIPETIDNAESVSIP